MCIILLLTIAEEIPLCDYRISIQDFSVSLIMLYYYVYNSKIPCALKNGIKIDWAWLSNMRCGFGNSKTIVYSCPFMALIWLEHFKHD